ncbi:MAG TPA: WG repeat-containing protein [Pyrinomonadaceae bacterium]|jgi:hypothetical protein|nr:WG repeat-containing protein [Pyrinomonadaceae bacterium]
MLRSAPARALLATLCLTLLVCATPAAACSWDYLIWMPRHRDADPLYRFVRGGKAGYIDRAGSIVVEPKFEVYGNGSGYFSDGLLKVGVASGEYVDAAGKTAIEDKFSSSWAFSEGLAAALDEKTKTWGYIDSAGRFAISPRFETYPHGYVSSFSGGLARIEVKDRHGFIDRAGEFVIAPTFLMADDFSDGMARVVVEGPCAYSGDGPCPDFRILGRARDERRVPPCKFTFVDRGGSVLGARFDGAGKFSEGLAPFKRGGKWGYVDKTGRVVIAPRFDGAQPFSEGLARVTQGRLYGFIDRSGEFAVPPGFEYADDFSEGLAAVGSLRREGPGDLRYIDRSGRAVIAGPFYRASHFFKGLAHVEFAPLKKGDDPLHTRRFAYVDAAGKTVFAYEVERED